ncbi:hypothetical protein KKF81_04870 [Candidatus Micrarchaeota archaeon]|nr:hypothetical protein [Candidatus Micrarchaeota archaeon]MBU1166260.1 hypothetical protein [Candidatus Micrarchaeota archaeon]
MIKECVGFVENYGYLKDKSLRDKSRDLLCEFLVDDILLATNYEDDEQKICVILPFHLSGSENGKLKLAKEKIFVKTIAGKVSNEIFSEDELGVIGEYHYTAEEVNEIYNIIENTRKHLQLIPVYNKQDMNKLIGGNKTILSPVIYAFKVNKKKETFERAISRFMSKEKLKKCKYDKKQLPQLQLFNSIGTEIDSILTNELDYLKTKISEKETLFSAEKKKNVPAKVFFIVLLPSLAAFKLKQLLPDAYNYHSIYSFLRIEFLKAQSTINAQKTKNNCMCCNKSEYLDAPVPFITYSSKKPFLEHKTRHSKEKNFLICGRCALLYRLFFDYVSINNIKIMPLFVDSNLQKMEITLISKKGVNSFADIFNQLQNKDCDFYLFLLKLSNGGKPCRELFFYDYIFNYCWILGEFKFYSHKGFIRVSRVFLESRIKSILGIAGHFPYFEKLDGKAEWITYLFNSLQEKLFNYTYRNVSQLTHLDFLNLFILPIEYHALSNPKLFWSNSGAVTDSLDLWFNQKLFTKETEVDVMKMDELQKSEPDTSAEAWAFHAGRFYRFLVEKSKADGGSKKVLELEAIVACNQIKRVRLVLGDKFGCRSYAITDAELQNSGISGDKILATNSYDLVGFREFKPYFYAGYICYLKNKLR